MLPLLALVSLRGQSPTAPALRSRMEFGHAMAKIERGSSMDYVKMLLGAPEDVWPGDDSRAYIPIPGDVAWCYGTNGHHTMPTLGLVMFREGTVLYATGMGGHPPLVTDGKGHQFMTNGLGEPPAESLIGESELRTALRAMYRITDPSDPFRADPQRLIQAANIFIGSGRAKSLAIMFEYLRVGWQPREDQAWLVWLVRIAFTSRRAAGVFALPTYLRMGPEPPRDLRSWPTFPVVTVDDVPINPYEPGQIAGLAFRFYPYLVENQKDWEMRSTPLVPPDDPFLVYRDLVARSDWPLVRGYSFDGGSRRFWALEVHAKRQILMLVSSAYVPSTGDGITHFEECHREYLALGCHWDPSRQLYVRRDGSTLTTPTH
jgi:hypothetical protein